MMACDEKRGKVAFEEPQVVRQCHVTNGEDIVEVDRLGEYTLAWTEGRHRWLAVIPPEGFTTVGRYWQYDPGPHPATFRLRRVAPVGGRRFTVLHITDSHVGPLGEPPGHVAGTHADQRLDLPSPRRLQRAIRALLRAAPEVRLIVATGDLTDNGEPEALGAVASALEALPVPVLAVFGGHDGNMDRFAHGGLGRYNVTSWLRHLSPPWYAWHWGGRLFLCIVSEESKFLDEPARQAQLVFIQRALALFGRMRPVTVCAHKPPSEDRLNLFHGYRVDSWLHGHFHSTRTLNLNGIRVFSTSSLAFGGLDSIDAPARTVQYDAATTPVAPVCRYRKARAARRSDASEAEVAWSADSSAFATLAEPCLVGHRIYVGGTDHAAGLNGGVTCLSAADGRQHWRTAMDGSIEAPVVVSDERLVAVTQTGVVYCLNRSDGHILWRFAMPEPLHRWVYSRSLIVDGAVVVGTTSCLVCLTLGEGRLRWSYRDASKPSDAFGQLQGPAYSGGRIVLPGYHTQTCLIDLRTGCAQPAPPVQKVRFSSRAAVEAGEYIVGDGVGNLYCFDLASGQCRWKQSVSRNAITAAFVPFMGGLLGATAEGALLCSRTDGSPLATHRFARDLGMYVPYRFRATSSPGTPLIHGERAWFASGDGHLNLLCGRELRCAARLNAGAVITAPLVRLEDGRRLVGVTCEGELRCFAVDP